MQYKFYNLKFLYYKTNLYCIQCFQLVFQTNMQMHKAPNSGDNQLVIFKELDKYDFINFKLHNFILQPHLYFS